MSGAGLLALPVENDENFLKRCSIELADVISEAVGDFGSPGVEAGRINRDAWMRDAGKTYNFFRIIPYDVEEGQYPLNQMPARPAALSMLKRR